MSPSPLRRKQENEISQLKEQALVKPATLSAATDKLEQSKQQSADRQALSEKIESLRHENDLLRRAKLEVRSGALRFFFKVDSPDGLLTYSWNLTSRS